MHDIYLMHKTTGELIPYTTAFNNWNKTPHNYLESVFDNYIETNIPVENSELAAPDFIGCVNR